MRGAPIRRAGLRVRVDELACERVNVLLPIFLASYISARVIACYQPCPHGTRGFTASLRER